MRWVFAVYTPRGHAVLTTIGRKSGRRRHNYVRAIQRRDKIYIVMMRLPEVALERPLFVSAWLRNIRTNPNVGIRLGRRVHAGVAQEVSDPDELELARAALCSTVHAIDWAEFILHARGLPSPAKIKALHRYWFDTGIPLIIDLACEDRG